MRRNWMAVVVVAAVVEGGCAILGPSCTARREEGIVATLGGSVEAGGVAVHDVAYATQGSQNDVQITWEGQALAEGPRLQLVATRTACRELASPAAATTGDCAPLARAGWIDVGRIATTLIVTHGRGNPEVLGQPPAYRVWVFADAVRPAHYTLAIRYFYGPDC